METKQVRSAEVKFYSTPEKKEEVEQAAEQENRTVSNFVRHATQYYIENEVDQK